MTQIQWPRQAQTWGAFLPQVTVQIRRADPVVNMGVMPTGGMVGGAPGFTTVRRTALGGGAALGQTTGEALYQRAKTEIQRFDALVQRTLRIANKTVRDQIIQDFGLNEPLNKDKAQYVRDAMASEVDRAESYGRPNYYFFEAPGPQRNRPGKLGALNDAFEGAVKDAEITYGILPEPITTTLTRTIESPLTTPILIGAAVVAAALLLS